VVLSFAGGSVWTSQSTGTCIWYFPILGDLEVSALFEPDGAGKPVIDGNHAYLIWVSDWSIQTASVNGPLSLAVLPAGEATVYFSKNPTTRDWSNRNTWGVAVAKFTRGGGLFQSPDGWQSDKFFFSAWLTSSKDFHIGSGKQFNFRDLIHRGMTCFEFGLNGSTYEAGTCTSMGGE
jgi:hypothetical protein